MHLYKSVAYQCYILILVHHQGWWWDHLLLLLLLLLLQLCTVATFALIIETKEITK
jgi:hypothetical protein